MFRNVNAGSGLAAAAGAVSFHYVISQTFATVHHAACLETKLVAGDDALQAEWWTLDAVAAGCAAGRVSGSVEGVVVRAESLLAAGLLPCGA